MKCSLVISTYNYPSALNLSLRSALEQTQLPDEILIADDGSKPFTGRLVQSFAEKSPIPIHHVWHEDVGFTVSMIRNKALARAQYPYIIQIDGDMILERHFIEDHLKRARPGVFYVGSRVLLSPDFTLSLQTADHPPIRPWSQGVKNRLNAIRWPMVAPLFERPTRDPRVAMYDIRGCNMGYWLDDAIRVNGYDEVYVGWGREDSDFGIRLINSGCEIRHLKHVAIQYHQYHDHRSTDRLTANDDLMLRTIEDQVIRCRDGMDQWMASREDVS